MWTHWVSGWAPGRDARPLTPNPGTRDRIRGALGCTGPQGPPGHCPFWPLPLPHPETRPPRSLIGAIQRHRVCPRYVDGAILRGPPDSYARAPWGPRGATQHSLPSLPSPASSAADSSPWTSSPNCHPGLPPACRPGDGQRPQGPRPELKLPSVVATSKVALLFRGWRACPPGAFCSYSNDLTGPLSVLAGLARAASPRPALAQGA